MKILQITFSLSSGGLERFIVDLSNELGKTNDVTLLTLKDDKVNPQQSQFYKFDLSDKVKYVNLGLPQKYSPLNLWKVYRYIKKFNPDVVHMHAVGMPKFCMLANWLLGKKITFVETIHSDMRNGYSSFVYDFVHATLGRMKMIRFAAISDTNFKDFRRIYPHSLAEFINNGRAPIKRTDKFDDVTNEINSFKKDSNTKVVLHVARCHPQKNQQLLVGGANLLIKKGVNMTLVVLGSGYDSEAGAKLKSMACDSIHFIGPKTNVGDYLYNADVFTLSSSIEGMPISLLEAMLSGVPMVSTPVCGAVDVIDGKNGVLSKSFEVEDYANALATVIENNEFYKKHALEGMGDSPYTIKRCAEKYMEFYKRKG